MAYLTSSGYQDWRRGRPYIFHFKTDPGHVVSVCGIIMRHKVPAEMLRNDMKALICERCKSILHL